MAVATTKSSQAKKTLHILSGAKFIENVYALGKLASPAKTNSSTVHSIIATGNWSSPENKINNFFLQKRTKIK